MCSSDLWVKDEGIGIAKKYHRAVFRQFFRVPTGNVHTVKGVGLGLYYVWQVARAHGWRVGLESAPGRGSTFRFTGPAGTLPQPDPALVFTHQTPNRP